MSYIEVGMLVLGVVMLVVGYRKNSRNVLVGSALVLFASAALGDFVQGAKEGYAETAAAHEEQPAG